MDNRHSSIDRQKEEQTHKWMEGRTNRWTDEETVKWRKRWTNGQTDIWTDDRQTDTLFLINRVKFQLYTVLNAV